MSGGGGVAANLDKSAGLQSAIRNEPDFEVGRLERARRLGNEDTHFKGLHYRASIGRQ